MASTIKVDKIEGSTGSTITVPTGQTLTLTDGLAIGSLPTITVAKGGTNLTSFAAGDVLYATGSTTLAKLAKGSASQVLTMNSGATAPEWAAGASGGKTIQLKHTRYTGLTSWTHGSSGTATELDTGMRVTITPTSTSNYLILEAFVPLSGGGTTSIYNFMFYDVTGSAVFNPSAESIGSRGATWGRGLMGHRGSHADANDQNELYMRQIGLAPRTSATTFAIYGRGQSGSAFYINGDSGGSSTWGFTGQTLFTVTEMDLS